MTPENAPDTQPAHYTLVPGALEIDPQDPTVFMRACAAFDALAKAGLRRRSTDTPGSAPPALPASLWRPDTKKKAMR